MTGYTEKNTVQAGLIDLLVAQGWSHVEGKDTQAEASASWPAERMANSFSFAGHP